jgi:hypothetical protein
MHHVAQVMMNIPIGASKPKFPQLAAKNRGPAHSEMA